MSLFAPPVIAGWILALSLAHPMTSAVCVEAEVRQTGLPLNRVILDAMMHEAAAVWAPYGVAIRWTDGVHSDRCALGDASVAVQVDNTPTRRSTARALTLGTTRVAVSRARPVPIRLDYAAIDRLLGSMSAEAVGRVLGRQQLAPFDIGRALGRVLAHEIGHVLLDGFGHRRRGLMRASFVPSELVDHRRRTYTLSSAETAGLFRRSARRTAQSPDEAMAED